MNEKKQNKNEKNRIKALYECFTTTMSGDKYR